MMTRTSKWLCTVCQAQSVHEKQVPLLSDRARIIERILRMREDYAIGAMRIASLPKKLIVEIEVDEGFGGAIEATVK